MFLGLRLRKGSGAYVKVRAGLRMKALGQGPYLKGQGDLVSRLVTRIIGLLYGLWG